LVDEDSRIPSSLLPFLDSFHQMASNSNLAVLTFVEKVLVKCFHLRLTSWQESKGESNLSYRLGLKGAMSGRQHW
jgi:hypothetical protein